LAEHDIPTIDAVCELLFNAASLGEIGGSEHIVHFRAELDPEIRVAYFSMLVSINLFPPELRAKLTPDVERQVVAFFRDMDVVVKTVTDPEFGRCFLVNLPGELRGVSWDELSGRKRSS
jgi:hypothetical protein